MQLGVWKKNIFCYLKLNDSRTHTKMFRDIQNKEYFNDNKLQFQSEQ